MYADEHLSLTKIIVSNVEKYFDGHCVLNKVSRRFTAGQIHGIIGNNGSGKTVLMKCICGFLIPDRGEILVDGKKIGRDCDFPPDLGVIIETPGFLPGLPGLKNLMLLAAYRGIVKAPAVADVMRRVGLDPSDRKPVGKYSLGMRQRLGIAQAIMENPSLMILDEPFNGLDKDGVEEMRELLLSLKEQGKTILLASHNPLDIETLCDTVCEMDKGIMTITK